MHNILTGVLTFVELSEEAAARLEQVVRECRVDCTPPTKGSSVWSIADVCSSLILW